MRRVLIIAAVLGVAVVEAPAGGAAPKKKAPKVDQMVVFPSGKAVRKQVSTRAVRVKVRGRRCTAGTGTALAALVRGRPARISLRDFGSCSARAADGSGLFVSGIGRSRNKGRDGWVYKVGKRAATAGAADPSGPFGSGRLRSGKRVTWFYCRLVSGGCQRSLGMRFKSELDGISVIVSGYDDEGRGEREPGATVVVDGTEVDADENGVAHLVLGEGTHRVFARKDGRVRSFTERVVVK